METYYCLETWRVPRSLVRSNLCPADASPEERRAAEEAANETLEREYIRRHDGPFAKDSLTEQAPMSLFEEGSVMLALLFLIGGPLLWMGLGTGLLLLGSWTSLGWYAVATAVLSLHPLPDVAGATWRSSLVMWMYKYFSYRFVWAGNARDMCRQHHPYIGSGVPHGVMPFANLLAIPGVNSFLYAGNFVGAPASVVFRTPFLRYLTLLQCCDVGRAEVERQIGKGNIVGLVGDGIAGIFQCNEDDEVVALRDRKGLAKLALRTGTPVGPCYSLGNTQCFSAWFDSFGIMESISRKAQVSVFFYWGRFFLPIPRRQQIAMLVGDLILVDKVPDPTKEQVDELHARILDGFKSCFDQHKDALGWGHKTIRFV